VPGQHCLLAEGDIVAPVFTFANSSVRLAYFQANRLLYGLYKQETELLQRKYDGNTVVRPDYVSASQSVTIGYALVLSSAATGFKIL
jgi:hypothetical protein